MGRKFILGLGVSGLLLAFTGGLPAVAGEASGAELFAEHKCGMCHSVASEGIEATAKIEKMKGPDLGGYSSERETKQLLDYLTQAITLDENKHKKKFSGSAEDLEVILAWLKTLDAAPAK
jgi:hypothetical protein